MFYKETDFKGTPLGEIPAQWDVVKLEEILHLRNGERPRISNDGDVPVFGANGIMGYTKEVLVDNDFSLIVGRVGASGEIHLGEGKVWVSDNAIYSENYEKARAYLPYLFYSLKHRKLGQFASKTTHPIITQTFLNNFLVHLPPLSEQRGIVGVLGVVDSAVGLVDRVIAKTERLKKGLMQTLLTRGIGHTEYKQTPIGTTPKTWDVVKLGDIVSLEYGKGLPQNSRREGHYPVVGSNGIVGYHNEALVKGPGIVVGRKGTIGAVSWIDNDFWPIDTTYYVKTKRSDIFLRWLFFELTHLNLAKLHLADVVPGLKRDLAYSRIVPIPPLPEQRKIAEIISTIDKKLELERTEKTRLERIKRGLMDLLLTGKIRIKVD